MRKKRKFEECDSEIRGKTRNYGTKSCEFEKNEFVNI